MRLPLIPLSQLLLVLMTKLIFKSRHRYNICNVVKMHSRGAYCMVLIWALYTVRAGFDLLHPCCNNSKVAAFTVVKWYNFYHLSHLSSPILLCSNGHWICPGSLLLARNPWTEFVKLIEVLKMTGTNQTEEKENPCHHTEDKAQKRLIPAIFHHKLLFVWNKILICLKLLIRNQS